MPKRGQKIDKSKWEMIFFLKEMINPSLSECPGVIFSFRLLGKRQYHIRSQML